MTMFTSKNPNCLQKTKLIRNWKIYILRGFDIERKYMVSFQKMRQIRRLKWEQKVLRIKLFM